MSGIEPSLGEQPGIQEHVESGGVHGLSFGWHGGYWKVSLFTDREDMDVSAVARELGGGGHKKAAGFTCERLPFKLPGAGRQDDSLAAVKGPFHNDRYAR